MRELFTRSGWRSAFSLSVVALAWTVPLRAFGAGVVGTGVSGSCTEAALDAALASGGAVVFNCGPDPVTITVSREKIISRETSIDGGGLVTLSGGGTTRIIWVEKCKVVLSNLTIRDAINRTHSSDGGGALYNNRGTLIITNSQLSNNECNYEGGAIQSIAGRLVLTDDVFTDNRAPVGGGAFQDSGGTTQVTRCNFINNSAGGGGAFRNEIGRITVVDSTFSNNSATALGGAIENQGRLAVVNSTFSNNGAPYGGALFTSGPKCTVSNSTFASNSAANGGGAIYKSGSPPAARLQVINSTLWRNEVVNGVGGALSTDPQPPCSGTRCPRVARPVVSNSIVAGTASQANCGGITPIADGGYNLDSGTSCGFQVRLHSLNGTDPLLDPLGLADNGGPTQTIAPAAGSPAINAGNRRVCASTPIKNRDQRGFVRPGTGSTACTIGAYEFNSPSPVIP